MVTAQVNWIVYVLHFVFFYPMSRQGGVRYVLASVCVHSVRDNIITPTGKKKKDKKK